MKASYIFSYVIIMRTDYMNMKNRFFS